MRFRSGGEETATLAAQNYLAASVPDVARILAAKHGRRIASGKHLTSKLRMVGGH